MSGPIPAELTALPLLEVFVVGANSLAGGLTGKFTESLRILNVGANDLAGLLPNGLTRLDLNELLLREHRTVCAAFKRFRGVDGRDWMGATGGVCARGT